MRPALSTSGYRMEEPGSTADCLVPAGELFDTGRFGTVRVVARSCPLCDATGPAPIAGYGADIWRLVRCGPCGFVYLDRAPDYTALFAAMAWERTGAAELERRAGDPPRSLPPGPAPPKPPAALRPTEKGRPPPRPPAPAHRFDTRRRA